MNKRDLKKIDSYRSLFPPRIVVDISREEDGSFIAHVDTFKGMYTQGISFYELIEMINDAVRTYFEVPEKFISFMPNYAPSVKTAQQFDAFPLAHKKDNKVTLPLAIREKAKR